MFLRFRRKGAPAQCVLNFQEAVLYSVHEHNTTQHNARNKTKQNDKEVVFVCVLYCTSTQIISIEERAGANINYEY